MNLIKSTLIALLSLSAGQSFATGNRMPDDTPIRALTMGSEIIINDEMSSDIERSTDSSVIFYSFGNNEGNFQQKVIFRDSAGKKLTLKKGSNLILKNCSMEFRKTVTEGNMTSTKPGYLTCELQHPTIPAMSKYKPVFDIFKLPAGATIGDLRNANRNSLDFYFGDDGEIVF